MTTDNVRLGFIGLGAMGRPMVQNLLKAGFPVIVYDISLKDPDELRSAGATIAQSGDDVAGMSDIVQVMVRTEGQVEEVLFGQNGTGVVSNLRKDGIILIHSTISPRACADAAVKSAKAGIEIVDAPVTGSIKAAAEGNLSFIVGGTPQGISRCMFIMNTLGSTVTIVGKAGSAQVAKLINNMLAGVNSVAIAEGLSLGEAAGLETELIMAVINAGTGASFMSTHRDIVLEMGRNTDLVGLGYKDLLLALEEAHQLKVNLPVTAVANQFLASYHRESQADLTYLDKTK